MRPIRELPGACSGYTKKKVVSAWLAIVSKSMTVNIDLFHHVFISIAATFVFRITIVDYDRRQDPISLVGSAKLCNNQTEGSRSWFYAYCQT